MDAVMTDDNNNKMKAAQWQGYMTGKVEQIFEKIDSLKKDLKEDLNDFKREFRQDVKEIKKDVKENKDCIDTLKINAAKAGGKAGSIVSILVTATINAILYAIRRLGG